MEDGLRERLRLKQLQLEQAKRRLASTLQRLQAAKQQQNRTEKISCEDEASYSSYLFSVQKDQLVQKAYLQPAEMPKIQDKYESFFTQIYRRRELKQTAPKYRTLKELRLGLSERSLQRASYLHKRESSSRSRIAVNLRRESISERLKAK